MQVVIYIYIYIHGIKQVWRLECAERSRMTTSTQGVLFYLYANALRSQLVQSKLLTLSVVVVVRDFMKVITQIIALNIKFSIEIDNLNVEHSERWVMINI